MKASVLALFSMLLCFIQAQGQTFKYSEEVKGDTNADYMQLVANVGGYHHLLFFSAKQKPKLCIFDPRLKLYASLQMDNRVKDGTEIRIVPSNNDYLLYFHVPGSTQHDLWRIDSKGDQTPLSAQLQAVIQAQLTITTVTLQLLRQNDQLFLLSHTYYDSLQTVVSKVVQLDENLTVVNTKTVTFPFQRLQEALQQVDLDGDRLLILKSIRSSTEGNLLHLLQIDLNTGEKREQTFSSGSSAFVFPSFRQSTVDSSILVSAMVRSAPASQRYEAAFFVCRLNQMLEEKTPVRTVKMRFYGRLQQDYFLVNGTNPEWIEAKLSMRPPVMYQARVVYRNTPGSFYDPSASYHYSTIYGSTALQSQSMNIHLNLLSEQLTRLNDSVMTSKNNSPEFVPYASTTFHLLNKSYLLLLQQYPRNYQSLLLVSAAKEGRFATTELPVYGKNDYRLNALQPVASENAFIVPYFHKRQVGLVKITMTN